MGISKATRKEALEVETRVLRRGYRRADPAPSVKSADKAPETGAITGHHGTAPLPLLSTVGLL